MIHGIPHIAGLVLTASGAFLWWQANFPSRWYRVPRGPTVVMAWAIGVLGLAALIPFYQVSD